MSTENLRTMDMDNQEPREGSSLEVHPISMSMEDVSVMETSDQQMTEDASLTDRPEPMSVSSIDDSNLDISAQQSTEGDPSTGSFTFNEDIFGAPSIPGTLGEETLQLRIKEARAVFVSSKSFSHINRILDQYRHVTICGASGEGKTTMSLMLAREYMKKGYQTVFVDNIDRFDFSECIKVAPRIMLILDDIFGTVGLSTNILQLRKLLDAVKTHLQHCQRDSGKHSASEKKEKIGKQLDKPQYKDIRVVFTSKTYNFEEGISQMKYQKFSLFTGQTVVDLTANKDYCYSSVTKVAIFERHKKTNPSVSVQDVTEEVLLGLDETLFGFPFTCKLFFEFQTFRGNAKEFFNNPLFYLKMEISRLLDLKNNQTAALILMLLCEDKLDLNKLELEGQDKTTDDMFLLVKGIVPSATRSDIAIAARNFRGTFFSRGDSLQFAHPSIYDACASAMYDVNPSFVLRYCSYDFLYERVKSRTVEETGASEHRHFIFLSDNYHELIATKLAEGIRKGCFSKTIAHPILQNKQVLQFLFQKLQVQPSGCDDREKQWFNKNDRGKSFLYWAVNGNNTTLVQEIETILKKTFSQTNIREALYGCVENNNLTLLKFLLSKLNRGSKSQIKSELLLLTTKNGNREIAQHLLQEGAKISHVNKSKQNFIHLICQSGKSALLKDLKSHQDSFTQRENLLVLNSVDNNGRTPVMLAALSGSETCFQLLSTCISNYELKDSYSDLTLVDNYGDSLLHLACQGGNIEIVRHLLPSSNVNNRGRYGWTPVMNAAYSGHKDVFDFLVSHNADLTLVDFVGDRLLHLACRGGNIEIIRHLLLSSNINYRGEHCWTPVMVAAVSGRKGVFNFLVSHNADLTLVDGYGDSLLHLACQGGNIEIVRHLLTSSSINNRGEHGWTPVMSAAVNGHLGVFDFLVSHNADLTLVDVGGNSMLHLACHGGNMELVRHLLTSSSINNRGEHGWTPVMVAAVSGNKGVFDFLVSHNADLTLVDVVGNSMLHLACRGGNMELVRHLLTSSSINNRGEHGWTPVMSAAIKGHLGVFDFLVSHNADLTLVDVVGNSMLHLACRGGNMELVRHLLTSSSINNRGEHGWTPVMIAAVNGHLGVFDFLVSHNADLTLVDVGGNSMLHLACHGGNMELVRHLLTSSSINNRGGHGWTPVMVAAVSGNKGVFDFLVSHNADLTLVDVVGNSMLHLACRGGNMELVRHLLTSSSINNRGGHGWTPVMVAAVNGHLGVFDFLVSHNADLTLVDVVGNSMLHLACRGGNMELVRHLLTSSNINNRGEHGWTPVMNAAVSGHRKIIDLLVDNQVDLKLTSNYGTDIVSLTQTLGKSDDAEYLQTLLRK